VAAATTAGVHAETRVSVPKAAVPVRLPIRSVALQRLAVISPTVAALAPVRGQPQVQVLAVVPDAAVALVVVGQVATEGIPTVAAISAGARGNHLVARRVARAVTPATAHQVERISLIR